MLQIEYPPQKNEGLKVTVKEKWKGVKAEAFSGVDRDP